MKNVIRKSFFILQYIVILPDALWYILQYIRRWSGQSYCEAMYVHNMCILLITAIQNYLQLFLYQNFFSKWAGNSYQLTQGFVWYTTIVATFYMVEHMLSMWKVVNMPPGHAILWQPYLFWDLVILLAYPPIPCL